MSEQRFITTLRGRNYHRPDCTTGFHAHPILTMTESEARAAKKKPCGHCLGRT
jgi:hypothetical protein